VTPPACGADGTPDLSDSAPTTRSAQSETGRAASLAAIARGGNRRLGLAVLVIATAPVSVVLDTTSMNAALPHIRRALGLSDSGLRRDAAVASGIRPNARCDPDTGVLR
jgi:hypothetical protein